MEINFQDPWIITIIGGTAATILFSIVNKIYRLFVKKPKDNKPIESLRQRSSVINKIFIDNQGRSLNTTKIIDPREISYFKENTKILFIDDTDFKEKIKNIIKAGWKNVQQIKDADNIDRREIRDASIIFVDYKGVGKNCSEQQGLAVVSALKKRYNNTKWIILYSAHDVPVTALLKEPDSCLGKNSSVYEFEQKILEGLGKIDV